MTFLQHTYLRIPTTEAQPPSPPHIPPPPSPPLTSLIIMKNNTLGDFCLPKDKRLMEKSEMEDRSLFNRHRKLVQAHENLKAHCDDLTSENFSLKIQLNEAKKLIPSTTSPTSYAAIFKNPSTSSKTILKKSSTRSGLIHHVLIFSRLLCDSHLISKTPLILIQVPLTPHLQFHLQFLLPFCLILLQSHLNHL